MGSYFEKPASVPKLMQTMGNISYQSLDCAQKSRKSRKTVGNKFEKSLYCAQPPMLTPPAPPLMK
jgi:hypothetical protein